MDRTPDQTGFGSEFRMAVYCDVRAPSGGGSLQTMYKPTEIWARQGSTLGPRANHRLALPVGQRCDPG
jgi:hypothetical protein